SPDGKTIASASDDRTVRLWDAATGELRATLRGHRHRVTSVAFSPDGETLASGSWDKTVRLWKATGAPLKKLEGHDGWVTSVAFSPDGERIATTDDHALRVFALKDGESLKTIELQSVRAAVYSPDGKTLAVGTRLNGVKLYDAATFEETGSLPKSGDIASLAFSPDGELLASGGDAVQVWTTNGWRLRSKLEGHAESVKGLAWAPDSKMFVTASDDSTLLVWRRPR